MNLDGVLGRLMVERATASARVVECEQRIRSAPASQTAAQFEALCEAYDAACDALLQARHAEYNRYLALGRERELTWRPSDGVPRVEVRLRPARKLPGSHGGRHGENATNVEARQLARGAADEGSPDV